jgi:phosphomevalonate kinase
VTRAQAPGKLVLSGAYAVLSGAPAIVTAVSRYVIADTSRPAELVTDEVAAALAPGQRAPAFDASQLREAGRKLGLGSSAAILLASLFALERDADPSLEASGLRRALFTRALAAHRQAQGGGSGVDVAASCFGGTLVYRLGSAGVELRPVALPAQLIVEVWVCPTSASTRDFIAAVKALELRAPSEHAALLGAQAKASVQAAAALEAADPRAFIAALGAQHRALRALGSAAAIAIVTPELAESFPMAEAQGAVLLPAGAGGGDIALFVGLAPSSSALRARLEGHAHRLLEVGLSVPGVGPG